MGTGMLSNEEIVEYYRQDAVKLFRYINWLESKKRHALWTEIMCMYIPEIN